jgi:hypothetical protein
MTHRFFPHLIVSGLLFAGASLAFPATANACPYTALSRCKEQLLELIRLRADAIEAEFGDVFGTLPDDIRVEFVRKKDDPRFAEKPGYDPDRRTILIPRRMLGWRTPNPLRWAVYYWPFYTVKENRETYPVVETVDDLLWTVYLQEAARRRDLEWPHGGCDSSDVGERLPCEMIEEGIKDYLKDPQGEIFNANRLEMIWPDDYEQFRDSLWRGGDRKYYNMKHFGGILLVKPLIEEFGIPRALAYFAQTPFRIEDNNVRESALKYQERARREIM